MYPSIFPIHARVEHVCFIVRDIMNAMRVYSAMFGVRRWYRVKMKKYEIFYRGNPVRIEWDIVMGYSGGVQIELINVLSSSGPNIYSEILGKDGEGFHHVCASVDDLDKSLSALREARIEAVQHGVTSLEGGPIGRYAYVDTRRISGCFLELLDVRLRGIKVKNAQWLLRLGELTGGVEGIPARHLDRR